MVRVDSAVAWACEKEYRPLRSGCIERIKGGRYADRRNHHPPVLHGRRPAGQCHLNLAPIAHGLRNEIHTGLKWLSSAIQRTRFFLASALAQLCQVRTGTL